MITISELRPYEDKTVRLRLLDGEVSTVKVNFIDPEYEDLIVDVIDTNRPNTYKDLNSAYTIAISEIAAVEEVSG